MLYSGWIWIFLFLHELLKQLSEVICKCLQYREIERVESFDFKSEFIYYIQAEFVIVLQF